MVGWEQPELFYILPCQYNYRTADQTDDTLDPRHREERFKSDGVFNVCDRQAKIFHRFVRPEDLL